MKIANILTEIYFQQGALRQGRTSKPLAMEALLLGPSTSSLDGVATATTTTAVVLPGPGRVRWWRASSPALHLTIRQILLVFIRQIVDFH